MTRLEYLNKNCFQCTKDLDECHGLILALQDFAQEMVDGTYFEYVFQEDGVDFLWEDALTNPVASLRLQGPSSDGGLLVQVGRYSRVIPRDDFKGIDLRELMDEIRAELRQRRPDAFRDRFFTVRFPPYIFISFVAGALLSHILTFKFCGGY